MRHRLICGACDKPAGWTTETVLHIKTSNVGGTGWNVDPIHLKAPDDPNAWPVVVRCPRCGVELGLDRPPWPRRHVVPSTGNRLKSRSE
jgi:hypothetical protein